MHPCMHAYLHTYIHPCMHACTHARTHTHTHIHAYLHPCMHTYIHTYTHTHTHIHIRIHTQIHIHIRIHIHVYIYIYYNFLCLFTPLGMNRGHIPEPQVMAASTGSEVTQALNRFITVLVVPWWIPGSWWFAMVDSMGVPWWFHGFNGISWDFMGKQHIFLWNRMGFSSRCSSFLVIF